MIGFIGILYLLLPILLLVASIFLYSSTAPAGTVLNGHAQVHDGDTIRIGQASIRLWGIDAAELKQRCGGTPCGEQARAALAAIIDGRVVTCFPHGKSYRRIVARCSVDGMDLGSAMARAGMAFDYARYSHGAYADDERAAHESRAGLWADGSEPIEEPAHWRACNLPQRRHNRPADCLDQSRG
ncbi:MAG: thermonuclease family protein [Rhodospirillales bacterium]|nr:thermonuclease family protein [Alphaproteobacteria bacterium]MCB9987456.1 thermonuclease family protein [Rhodospirillales bacterium]USO07565.1 MAG: thermonuclease family protein [Rhodospirillales bacterium]